MTLWMQGETGEALAVQKAAPDGTLKLGARGKRQDIA
jgi:hypothetical protein